MWLMAGVMLGAGLRQREVLELRVKVLDLERGAITVRQGKGDKDRVTVLPERIREGLKAHLEVRRVEYEQDLKEGAGYVLLPGALAQKKPAAAQSWAWQYVFGNSINQRNYRKKLDDGVRQPQPPRTPPPPPSADRPAVSRTTLTKAGSAA